MTETEKVLELIKQIGGEREGKYKRFIAIAKQYAKEEGMSEKVNSQLINSWKENGLPVKWKLLFKFKEKNTFAKVYGNSTRDD